MNGEMLRRYRVPASIIGALFAAALLGPRLDGAGYDAYCYWAGAPHPYSVGYFGLGAFAYSPAAASVFGIGSAVSWPVFHALWTAILALALVALVGRWSLAALLFAPVAFEIYVGNIHLLLALAIVASFRWPAAWSFVLLTKVTPGVGLLWYVVRREWRSLGVALGVTAAIVAASIVAGGIGTWLDWARYLEHGTPAEVSWLGPFWLRLPAAVALVVWGARTDRRWTVPVASMLALPVLWLPGFSVLVACVPLLRDAEVVERDAMRVRPVRSPKADVRRRERLDHVVVGALSRGR